MATIEDAVAAKVLELYELPDWESRLAIRPLWVAHTLWDWMDSVYELHDRKRGSGGRTMHEHTEQMFCEFRCAPVFPAGDLKQMMPNIDGVRTPPPGMRVYGFCPAAHSFVAVTAAIAAQTKADKSLNDTKRNEVLRFIEVNGLQNSVLKGDNLAVFPR